MRDKIYEIDNPNRNISLLWITHLSGELLPTQFHVKETPSLTIFNIERNNSKVRILFNKINPIVF